ncbi:Zinc finger RING-type [Arabidopsis suecica]|uniref:Zinc finger RING-type n=2 Tax=Arabidopsis suecica TaxID=45249 RepID=A0A8T2DK85_ARASU|nr:Zinc finger RING-type [Arabidopsis suecica]
MFALCVGLVSELELILSMMLLLLCGNDKKKIQEEIHEPSFGNHGGCCAICLSEIPLQETAMVKGCEHTYCVTCILRWASCKESPTCPQCKHPFDFLSVHRALDGSIEDFLFEESVCLLLRASWFVPLDVVEQASYRHGYHDDFDIPCDYEDEDDDLDEFYLHGSSLRIGNRRWGGNGFVRSGRQEARPVQRYSGSGSSSSSSSGSSSSEPKDKQVKTTNTTGRRAKRAMKREAANKAAEVTAAAKHEAHLVRLGRK